MSNLCKPLLYLAWIIIIALAFCGICFYAAPAVLPTYETKDITIVSIQDGSTEGLREASIFLVTSEREIYQARDAQIRAMLINGTTCRVKIMYSAGVRTPAKGIIDNIEKACVE